VLSDCLRPSRARRAFRRGHQLLTRRIATALPLAALERRRGPLLLDSILVTEAVEGRDLHQFLSRWLSTPATADAVLSPPEQRHLAQAVLWQLGRLLRRLHDSRFAHRDLKASNVLVRWSPGERPELVLIDLDGLRRVWWLTARRRFQGLMRLNVSLLKCPVVNHAGRLRMLLGYLRRPGAPRVNFKPYWRVLQRWSARKLQSQIRSRRQRQKAARRPAT
jgi:serine/threonine protein kinase